MFFVVRHKDNIRYTSIEERPLPKIHAQNVFIDEVIDSICPVLRQNNRNGSDGLLYGTMNAATRLNC